MKFSFSIQNRFGETLSVDDAHSFDEAIERVEKGVYQRDLEVGRRYHAAGLEIPPDIREKLEEAGEIEAVKAAAPEAKPEPKAAPAPSEAPKKDPEAPTMTQPLDVEVQAPAGAEGDKK
jgi:hypothetical protein